jgi:hypothetical protein
MLCEVGVVFALVVLDTTGAIGAVSSHGDINCLWQGSEDTGRSEDVLENLECAGSREGVSMSSSEKLERWKELLVAPEVRSRILYCTTSCA